MAPLLQQRLAELETLRGRQVEQLELQLGNSKQDEVFINARREKRMKEIKHAFADYESWVRDTISIEAVPHLQIIAAITANTEAEH